jgi:hypothetical protein
MFLGSGEKRSARRIAASVWNEINEEDLARTPQERLSIAKERVRERIRDNQAMRRRKVGFGWEAIIISLMTRLAIRLLEKWLEKRLFSVSEDGDE